MAIDSLPRIVVLASGGGTTFAALADASKQKQLNAQVVGVIADRRAAVFERALDRQIEAVLVEYRKDDEAWATRLLAVIQSFRPDYVVLAGFLRMIPLPVLNAFRGRIVNTHPSLLPKFGGKGMYGSKVHEAVIEAGEIETGITLHHVTEGYDEGAPIAQMRLKLNPGESPTSLENRLKDLEKKFLISELQKFIVACNRSGK